MVSSITLLSFSGVEKSAAVVIRSASKAFEARSDNTYRVKIKATVDVTAIFRTFHLEIEKTITVTVTRFHITTPASKALAMKVNLLPAKVNLSASAPVNFSKP
jgi:hypothetical protein